MEGQTCISSSNNLNHLFSDFVQQANQTNLSNGKNGHSKSLALDALKLALPNPNMLSLEDILELKLALKDELGLFYQTINAIEVKNKQLFDHNCSKNEY